MKKHPRIDDAPGLTWRPLKGNWEARWQARTDLILRGYIPKSRRIWLGNRPNETEIWHIQTQCQSLQAEMLVWGRGGIPQADPYDGTVHGLINAYQCDDDSRFRKLRPCSQKFYRALMRAIDNEFGSRRIQDLTGRDLIHWHGEYEAAGKVTMGHQLMTMLRSLAAFGETILEDAKCEKLRRHLKNLRFVMPVPRDQILSAEQATAIRNHVRLKSPSIALAQAFQFDCMLRQKDVIGEWVLMEQPGVSDVFDHGQKWLRGLRWEEIDSNMVLTHVTSKREKKITIDLKVAPMVQCEFGFKDREQYPASGPVIICETTRIPWRADHFRRQWRAAATAVGVPRSIRNMDSRAGAITEATEAGAPLESIKHAAAHSDISMTQRYAREGETKTAAVLKMRVEHRKNKHD
jgi:hypothetical protein